mmetsp:Transcript_2894/g.4969  ORF Transcript_2894/g.4969 Transcript_2894/m.4969 type:complete len:187 (-) Transcript_2894:639-1199(-)
MIATRTASSVSVKAQRQQAVRVQASLKPSVRAAPVVSTANASSMMVWQPVNNKQFETFSYLPPLTSQQIAKQVDYIVANGWVPCLEFAAEADAYVGDASTIRFKGTASGFYDNRYWTMWKLPMFGCNDASQVLTETARCTKAFPTSYVRLVAFDNKRQVQIISFLVQRPKSATDYCDVAKRSVAGA